MRNEDKSYKTSDQVRYLELEHVPLPSPSLGRLWMDPTPFLIKKDISVSSRGTEFMIRYKEIPMI